MDQDLELIYQTLKKCESMSHALQIISYDMETAAPKGGMEEDGENISWLSNEIFKLQKNTEFTEATERAYGKRADLDEWDNRLVTLLHRDLLRSKNVSPELDKEVSELYNAAYISWIEAKEKNDYNLFKDKLQAIYEAEKKLLLTRENVNPDNLYDSLLSDYEEGFTTTDLDQFFDELEKGIVPLLNKVRNAAYQPRHDFLTRPVALAKQEEFTKWILNFNRFDFNRGSVSTTEHPFTSQLGQNDVRVTTHYFETNFISNMYSIIHEGGHALFGQNVPDEVFSHHLGEGSLTMAKHESVSRFYENVIGRSKAYIHAIYPAFQELFHEEMGDVSEHDFYEGVNYVDLNNPLRTEADELTYTLHIIIRYRLEKEIMSGKVDFEHLNEKWNEMYKNILGIDNKNDSTGILQDVHWSSGFGYFPTYAMGNALNCIYVKKLDKEIGLEKTVSEGHMDEILDWMKKNIFAKAAIRDTKDWIKEITGEDFSAKPYIDYLTIKFTDLYHL